MGGVACDYLENPLGAVRLTFDNAVAAAAGDFDPSAFDRKDWGALDLFHNFLFHQHGLSQVPFLDRDSLRWIRPNTLVRFRGMVQDMFGNEMYIGAFKDDSTWRTNKFTDVPMFPMTSALQTRLWERCLLYCAPVPGQNSWTMEQSCNSRETPKKCMPGQGEKRRRDDDTGAMDFNMLDVEEQDSPSSSKRQKDYAVSQLEEKLVAPESRTKSNGFAANLNGCLVKVYDASEGYLKLNEVIEFIGVYTFDPELAVNDSDDLSFDLMEDATVHLPPSQVPRLHCLIHRKLGFQDFLSGLYTAELVPNVIREVRESFLRHLTAVLGNDSIAASFVLLHLLSWIHARVDVIAVGKLSLNLMGLTRESASIFGNQLAELLKSILPFSQSILLTVEYLNTSTLQPRKDNQMGRMTSGVLQLATGTHLMIDETYLNAGTLNSTGVENVRLLKHLMEWHMVEYDFEYYKLDMPADVQLLVLSEGKSNILPADLVVPFQPTSVTNANPTSEELQAWRWYLATLRSLTHSIDPDMQKVLEDDLVAARQEDQSLRSEDLSRLLTMGQLMSKSYGHTSLLIESWQMVRELERLRKERIK